MAKQENKKNFLINFLIAKANIGCITKSQSLHKAISDPDRSKLYVEFVPAKSSNISDQDQISSHPKNLFVPDQLARLMATNLDNTNSSFSLIF